MTIVLSLNTKKAIDQWLKKYPDNQRQSAVLFALHTVQDENGGWLSVPLMDAVAAYLEMPKIAVYEVSTFYSMYDLEKVGKYKIRVCTNIACLLRGSNIVMNHLKDKLKIEVGETTKDGRFTLKEVECLAACGGAPMMQIGRHVYENLTPEKINHILAELE